MKTICSVIFLPFFIILLLVTAVIGSDWIEYDRDDNGNILLYKKGNIENNGAKDIVRIWEKRIYSDTGRERYIQDRIKEGMSTEGYNNLSNTQDLYRIDCKKKMMNLVSVFRYDKNGKVMYSNYIEAPEWNHIIPNSLMDTLRKKVCE